MSEPAEAAAASPPETAATATPPTAAPAPARQPKFEEIILDAPIMRGTTAIEKFQLRKPSAGEMRGLQLQSLMQFDVNSIIALVPRISVPPILQHEVEGMDADDFAQVAGAIQGFFMSKKDQALMAKVMGVIDQET